MEVSFLKGDESNSEGTFGCFKVFDLTSAQSSLLSFVVCGQ